MKKNTGAALIREVLIFSVTASVILSMSGESAAITLSEALEKALSSSDQAALIEAGKRYSFAEADKVDTFTRPQLTTSLKYNELGTTAEESIFVPIPDREMTAGVAASQLVWAGGRIGESRALKTELKKLAVLEESSMKRDLIRQVSTAFVEVLYQQARLNVLKDRVNQRKDEMSDATDLFNAGTVTNLDVREAKLQLHVAQDELRSGESQLHTALVDFNLAIGSDADSPDSLLVPDGALARPDNLGENLIRLDELYRQKSQIDIKRAGEALSISERSLRMVKGEAKPTVSLVAGTEYDGEKASEMETSWSVGAQLTWNFYDGGSVDASIASARAEHNSRRSTLKKVEKNISGTLDKLKTEVASLQKRIVLQEDTVTLSNGNYEDARGLYGTGTMTLTRLGDFNLLYAEARFNLLQLYYLENLVSIEISALVDSGVIDSGNGGKL